MKHPTVALVAPADAIRIQLARYLREADYEVIECEALAIATRFTGIVLVDDDANEAIRAKVQSWIKQADPPRVVVISQRPTGWRTLALALGDYLSVLAAPSFGWDIVDALRAVPSDLPPPA